MGEIRDQIRLRMTGLIDSAIRDDKKASNENQSYSKRMNSSDCFRENVSSSDDVENQNRLVRRQQVSFEWRSWCGAPSEKR